MRLALAAAVCAIALSGCGKEPRKTESTPAPAVSVTTVVAQEVEWPSVYEANGTVRARVSASLASKVMGSVREMRVKAGDHVRSGQLVAVIDSRDLEAGMRQARAAVEEARSGIPEADNAIAAAKAQLDLATVTFKRMQDLYDQRSISNQEYDEAKSRLSVAEAGHQMAISKRRQLDAKIRLAQESEGAASVTRSFAEIRAPFNGVITEKRADHGDMAAPGAPLVTVEQSGAYQLEIPVEEGRLGVIRAGQPVSITLAAFDNTIKARVTEVVPSIHPLSRTFIVKVLLPADARLHSGLFGRARFIIASRRTIAVPEAAVRTVGQVQSVTVVEDGVARTRLVSLGERNGAVIEVLSGISAGDRIVTPRPANLTDGGKVEIRL
jgi:RND family efflux transporter MFP subunit